MTSLDTGSTVRVLVVEDDELVRRSVGRILRRAGYTVDMAQNVKEATQFSTTHRLSAALVDFALVHEDGLQVLAMLREVQPSCLRILMTGKTDFPMVVEAVNRGEVMRVVRKPFEARELLNILENAFVSARQLAEATTTRQREEDLRNREMLNECLTGGLMRLAVQPIVTATPPHAVWAYEALLRSLHHTLKSPLAILRSAERHRKINEVSAEVFILAAGWMNRIPASTGLFVNLHPQQLGEPDRLVRDLTPLHAFATRVTLEITERSRLHDISRWEDSVSALSDIGFSIAIDDLGAGYNSLAMLADLQPRYIKLDMSLVRNVDTEPRKQRLVQVMASFAEATNSHIIGEGVETAAEAMALIDCGIHLMQGYYFARPSMEAAPLATAAISGDTVFD